MYKNLYKLHKNFSICTLLSFICIFYYIATIIFVFISENRFTLSFSAAELSDFGAKNNFLITENHEYYRLITCAFMHVSFLHLISNVISLQIIGMFIENIFGSFKCGLIAIVSAVFTSISSFTFAPNAVSAGISGVVFAFFGVHLALFLLRKNYYKSLVGMDILGLLVLNIVLNMMPNGFLNFSVDVAAHFSGIFIGLVLGALFIVIKIKKEAVAIFSVLMLSATLCVSLLLFGINKYKNSEIYAYQKIIYSFEKGKEEGISTLIKYANKFPNSSRISDLYYLLNSPLKELETR